MEPLAIEELCLAARYSTQLTGKRLRYLEVVIQQLTTTMRETNSQRLEIQKKTRGRNEQEKKIRKYGDATSKATRRKEGILEGWSTSGRNIKKKNWLSSTEKEELEREITHNELQEDKLRDDATEDNRDDEISNHDTQRNTDEVTERMECVQMIRQWMEPDTERTKIPSKKAHNTKKLREKTSEVNEIMRVMHTTTVTETNNLTYAGARLIAELMVIRTPTQPTQQKPKQQPPWKRHLEKQIMVIRSDLSKLKEMEKKRLRSKKTMEELNKKYKIQAKGLNNIIEDVKQRLKAKAHKIQRYINRNKGCQQNKLLGTNQKRLYSHLRGEDNHQEIPKAEPSNRLWENIWNNPISHNKRTSWLQKIKEKETIRIKQDLQRSRQIQLDTN
ncbi:uncharacterized protein [Palaemon carinicauda]|uniref:uncharacterized protein n=1 Tax=Palaemon carinicauda TaxID=392227 RepID=UPI0035B61AB9